MSESKLSAEARAIFQFERRARGALILSLRSEGKFTPSYGKRRRSAKGQRTHSWYTKAWTESRRPRLEALSPLVP